MKIPELKIEVQNKETQEEKPFNEIKIKKGWRLLKPHEAMSLWANKKYRDKLKLHWFFVDSKDTGYPVARFVAYSDWASLYCDRDPGDSGSRLGVRLCRDLEEK